MCKFFDFCVIMRFCILYLFLFLSGWMVFIQVSIFQNNFTFKLNRFLHIGCDLLGFSIYIDIAVWTINIINVGFCIGVQCRMLIIFRGSALIAYSVIFVLIEADGFSVVVHVFGVGQSADVADVAGLADFNTNCTDRPVDLLSRAGVSVQLVREIGEVQFF